MYRCMAAGSVRPRTHAGRSIAGMEAGIGPCVRWRADEGGASAHAGFAYNGWEGSVAHPTPPVPTTNRLLDRLGMKERARVLSRCEPAVLAYPQVVGEAGAAIAHVYFPTGSSISLMTPIEGKNRIEVGLAGSEGMYGVPVAMGVRVSPVRAIVQGGGLAWRMGSTAFVRELARAPPLRHCVDRYIYVLMNQLIRNAGCNRFHRVEQRVARRLLMAADRARSSSFHITHELLASVLGVRRVGITEAASALQVRGLIGYTRGAMTIHDRKGLERASCPCYRADLSIYERLFREVGCRADP